MVFRRLKSSASMGSAFRKIIQVACSIVLRFCDFMMRFVTWLLFTTLFVFSCAIVTRANFGSYGPPLNMEEMLDTSTLDTEIIQDWYVVVGVIPTRQKYVTIRVGELWPGQDYRVPVRMIVPLDKKAKGFHLTGGHQLKGIEKDAVIDGVSLELLKGGVGLVYTIVQNPELWGNAELGAEMRRRFIETLNTRYSIQFWGWPASLCRAVTAAYSETDYFTKGKIAMSGGSKNGASPSVSLIHDRRLMALHASRSPIWDSPLRMGDEEAWEALNIADQSFAHREGLDEKGRTRITQHIFRGGYFGPNIKPDAIAQGHSWETLKSLADQMADHVFISRNLAELDARNVDLYFDPGTHDYVCFDVPGGAHTIPGSRST